MSNGRKLRLIQVAKEFKVGINTITDFLHKKGINIDGSPNEVVETETYALLEKEFGVNRSVKDDRASIRERINLKSTSVSIDSSSAKESKVSSPAESEDEDNEKQILIKSNVIKSPSSTFKVLGKIDLSEGKNKPKPIFEQKEETPIVEVTPAERPEVAKPEVKIEEVKVEKIKVEETKIEEIVKSPIKAEEPKAEVKSESQPAVEVVEPNTNRVEKMQDTTAKAAEVTTPEVKTTTPEIKKEQPAAKPIAVETKIEVKSEEKKSDENTATSKPSSTGEDELYRVKVNNLTGPNVLGKMDVSAFTPGGKHKRKRLNKEKVDINKPANGDNKGGGQKSKQQQGGQKGVQNKGGQQNQQNQQNQQSQQGPGRKNKKAKQNNNRQFDNTPKVEISDEEVSKQVKDTLARLTSKSVKGKGAKYRKDKRDAYAERMDEQMEREQKEKSILKVTEFVTVSELATMMGVGATDVIMACMNLGLMVSINQRLDAEALVVVAEEFGFTIEFVSVEIQEAIDDDDVDSEDSLVSRPPIVTVMGHVDHGKTSLLDNIRKANVIEGEAGGITQHIGAYSTELNGQRITFLDTPGHEAFTAMRARGAKVTDVAIIIVSADDSVMPQTTEAINHAQAAGVPMVFAINKCDKPAANPERIKEQLAAMNYLVEDWGGKYQSQDVSAKMGMNLDKLLEKVLLEAELLDLKANPDRKAVGTIIESTLDKGRGYVSTILVQNGTLKIGDVILSGTYTGRVKAMFNENGIKVTVAGPSTPVQVLGLNGAPQAGDTFNVMDDDRSAREVATKREQLQRMQGLMTQKHVTLDDIGRRIAIGSFKELNIIVKGDVDGSIEAMSGSLIKLSKEEVQINVIHAAVGQISESDVLLAAASNAIIVGFQVRPSASARKLAEKEEVELRMYSIIYDAINNIKDAIEGMLEPVMKEEIVCSVEVLEVFKISKVGTVAGCMVREGKISRNTSIRVIRDGIVIYTGKLGSLKRFKDDVKEVTSGLDCGLNIESFNDVKIGDIIEGYEQVEVKR
ncbi:MAG: translation initiation factor IF-2 [Rikenellaceae bacterium]